MTKTALDVCTMALRLLGVSPVGEVLAADDHAEALLHLNDIFSTVQGRPYQLGFDWTVETVPDGAYLPLARMVAGSVATTYGVPALSVLYGEGLRGLKAFAAADMHDSNAVTRAQYF